MKLFCGLNSPVRNKFYSEQIRWTPLFFILTNK